MVEMDKMEQFLTIRTVFFVELVYVGSILEFTLNHLSKFRMFSCPVILIV